MPYCQEHMQALPLIGGHLAQFAVGLTDTVMIGWYGVEELAALTLAHSYFFTIFIMGSGFAWAVMPMVAAAFGLVVALVIGLSVGGTALMMTLAASASYIAVPAAMRVALPEANPSIYLTLSLGVTFPFNLIFGIPAYLAVAQTLSRG